MHTIRLFVTWLALLALLCSCTAGMAEALGSDLSSWYSADAYQAELTIPGQEALRLVGGLTEDGEAMLLVYASDAKGEPSRIGDIVFSQTGMTYVDAEGRTGAIAYAEILRAQGFALPGDVNSTEDVLEALMQQWNILQNTVTKLSGNILGHSLTVKYGENGGTYTLDARLDLHRLLLENTETVQMYLQKHTNTIYAVLNMLNVHPPMNLPSVIMNMGKWQLEELPTVELHAAWNSSKTPTTSIVLRAARGKDEWLLEAQCLDGRISGTVLAQKARYCLEGAAVGNMLNLRLIPDGERVPLATLNAVSGEEPSVSLVGSGFSVSANIDSSRMLRVDADLGAQFQLSASAQMYAERHMWDNNLGRWVTRNVPFNAEVYLRRGEEHDRLTISEKEAQYTNSHRNVIREQHTLTYASDEHLLHLRYAGIKGKKQEQTAELLVDLNGQACEAKLLSNGETEVVMKVMPLMGKIESIK